MANSRVWSHGKELGGLPCGYSGFRFERKRYLRSGSEANVVTVRLTPEDHSSRWYAGADNLVRFTVTGSGTIAGVERQLAAMSDMV